MRIDSKQSRYLGITLIVIGVFAALRLWWLFPTMVLGAAGAYFYMQRRQAGRINEAVQGGLWLGGLAVMFLLHFVWPGILLLAGGSLLLRGREEEADRRIQHFIARIKSRRNSVTAQSTRNVPIQSSSPAPQAPADNDEAASTGETVRL